MEKNIEIYFKKLEQSGVSSEACENIKNKLGKAIFNASYGMKSSDGMAYEGSMIEISLKKLAVFAVNLNNLYPEEIRVDVKSIVKVCLLQHISKGLRYIKSNDTWRINNLGEIYTFNSENMPAIGFGLHSMLMAMECGVTFTPFEAEAMTIIDRKDDDAQAKYYSSLLTNIVKQANEMVYNCYSNMQKIKGN